MGDSHLSLLAHLLSTLFTIDSGEVALCLLVGDREGGHAPLLLAFRPNSFLLNLHKVGVAQNNAEHAVRELQITVLLSYIQEQILLLVIRLPCQVLQQRGLLHTLGLQLGDHLLELRI